MGKWFTEHPCVAMLGGTFNPVHSAHLRSAVELQEALELDCVHMVLSHMPPHREAPGVSSQDRFAMLKAGIGETPHVIADDREIAREGFSYSLDTLASLRQQYGQQARLVMAIGIDSFLSLPQWHRPEALFDYAHLVVIDRPGYQFEMAEDLVRLVAGREVDSREALMATPHGKMLHISLSTQMAISATSIRERLSDGKSVRYLIPDAVEHYIQRHLLYQQNDV
ncbi:nicotinate-nucleotide adenylyltransferase [Phytohalomonas tamaricis]|uniref:nicotinate-nucleotide adenylyltransferase n=1 Tax=Phytohalomonas tamaricis TaxID=2081032 RepID=UPI000D0ABA76|nr:nicotinate-nucleotide adenylyltransferase [Phytohalomonas tamaricis]